MRARFRVRGRVQGVGFRWWTAHVGREIGVAGRVRNRVDGSVEVEAAGSEAQLETLRERLRAGPDAARVDRLDELPAGEDPLPDPFAIVR